MGWTFNFAARRPVICGGPEQKADAAPARQARTASVSMADENGRDYFCQVRFLWRLSRSFFRRLCLLIFAFRRFFREPIIIAC